MFRRLKKLKSYGNLFENSFPWLYILYKNTKIGHY